MAFILTTGKGFIKDLEKSGALAAYVPLEGGYEGRFQRRVRAAGYTVVNRSARGLGDLSAYLMDVHGIRPPHLGKKSSGNEASVGERQFVMPILGYALENLPAQSKGLVLWLIEGIVLASHEVAYLARLPEIEPRIKVVVEMGGDREFTWRKLSPELVGV